MIAVDLQPYTIVENRGFNGLLKEAVSGYRPSSRMTLSHTLLPMFYDNTRKRVQLELLKAFETGMESLIYV